ncbi:hypothetical protein [uncultured Psychroserpens sp.]|uniref:hypothetical protein n=1 Tax=uncultured Psychroserpens sp. TaxID=255436 RepID=UPI002623ABD2|nr:hypothetical protein [uncultured Psychroserpens sp.]
MKLKIIYFHILVLTCVLSHDHISDRREDNTFSDIKLLTDKSVFQAGEPITLQFSSTNNSIAPQLYCTNSHGSTLLEPLKKGTLIDYKLPDYMTRKIGVLHWRLLNNNSLIRGSIEIVSKKQVAHMETYIGPPSIEAGGTDYTMLVVIPTDSLDNPLPDNTTVVTKHQFLTKISTDTVKTRHLIAYKNINSEIKSGRMLVSSESHNTNSKEFTINVLPSIPKGFTISAQRPHDYADGNQQTVFSTSVLKDSYGNVVSDGTFVSFFITTNNGNILKSYGKTIKGVAEARMIHPDHQSQWNVQAYVTGMAESNTITLTYKQVFKEFNVEFSDNNRTITVGPLQSFMKQMAPDGLEIKLYIYKNNELLEQRIKFSVDGFAHFKLKPNILENDTYDFKIKTAGIEQSFNSKTLW